MKFGSLMHTERKTFKVRNFKAGTVKGRLASDIPDNALSDSLNMWSNGGILCTRPGLFSDSENIIKSENPPFYDSFSYKVTDSAVYVNGEYKKIAVEEYCAEDSFYYCNIFFVGADGSSTSAGYFVLNRISSEDFYQPTNILFYSGSAVNGAGVFALVSTRNIYDYTQKGYRIYELSENLNSWQELNSFYIPVVYINGRGNRYEEARATGYAYAGKPMLLESQNMLTDSFKAYFTSDGYSSCFRLPITDLNEEAVICRVYINPTKYTEWHITEGQSSVTATFYNAQITLNIDRKKGMLNFTDSEGDYPIPMMNMYHENNICVKAGKTVKDGFDRAVSSSCCAEYGSRILFSGGIEKGRIFSVHTDNPLYFPCDSSFTVGEDDGINALLSYKNGILAFRQNEIYALTLKCGSAINSNSLLADNDSIFYNSDSFTVKKISGDKGLKNKFSCLIYGDDAVWLGSDRAVYALNTSSLEIAKLSDAVEEFFGSLSNSEAAGAFAVKNGNRYLLLIGKKAVIMDFRDAGLKNPAWYIWSFPTTETMGGFYCADKLTIFCKGTDSKVFYTAKLSGEEDTDICLNGSSPIIKKEYVSGSAVTKSFDFGSMSGKKLIDSINFSASSVGKLEIFINGKSFDRLSLGAPDMDYTCGTLKSVKLIPHLSAVRSAQIKFCSDNAFTLGELIINYRDTV